MYSKFLPKPVSYTHLFTCLTDLLYPYTNVLSFILTHTTLLFSSLQSGNMVNGVFELNTVLLNLNNFINSVFCYSDYKVPGFSNQVF